MRQEEVPDCTGEAVDSMSMLTAAFTFVGRVESRCVESRVGLGLGLGLAPIRQGQKGAFVLACPYVSTALMSRSPAQRFSALDGDASSDSQLAATTRTTAGVVQGHAGLDRKRTLPFLSRGPAAASIRQMLAGCFRVSERLYSLLNLLLQSEPADLSEHSPRAL